MQTIIGIDCATQPAKVGLALAEVVGQSLRILECRTASKNQPPARAISRWLARPGNILLALDAPLGWTESLPRVLSGHQAGQSLGKVSANGLFRRWTDDEMHRRLGKRPLEIGANLISRTAVSALQLLDELRAESGYPIPLAWRARESARLRAIEVYPAATRIAHGVRSRRVRFDAFGNDISCAAGLGMPGNEDAEDAAVCAIAGFDFLMGRSVAPPAKRHQRALIEGWIWVPDRVEPS